MIYRIKITLPESKVFYRVYAVRPDITLYELHTFICSDLGFDPDQMVFFDSRDPQQKSTGRYGLFDTGNGTMDQVTLRKAIADGNTIRYWFDMRLKRYLSIALESETDDNPKIEVPGLLEGKGDNPDQFSGKYIDPEPVDFTPSKSRFSDDDDDFDDEDDDDEDEEDEDEEVDDDEDGKLLVDEDYGK